MYHKAGFLDYTIPMVHTHLIKNAIFTASIQLLQKNGFFPKLMTISTLRVIAKVPFSVIEL